VGAGAQFRIAGEEPLGGREPVQHLPPIVSERRDGSPVARVELTVHRCDRGALHHSLDVLAHELALSHAPAL
jgi:hypothetical protein